MSRQSSSTQIVSEANRLVRARRLRGGSGMLERRLRSIRIVVDPWLREVSKEEFRLYVMLVVY